MPINLNDNIKIEAGKPIDSIYFSSDNVPYLNISHVLNDIPESYRYIGMTININGEEYWFKNGTSDENIIKKRIRT